MTVYFAWVDLDDGAAPEFSAVHEVQDEDVFAFEVVHGEGEIPQLVVEVRNQGVGLIAATRKRWAWLSRDTGSGAEPLFFGRVVGAPEDVSSTTQRIVLIARAPDSNAQKEALADTLRTLPEYDPVWVSEDRRDDPDLVLESRSALWHTDRLSGEVTISDYCIGEAGPVTLNSFRDGLSFRYSTTARRQVKVEAAVSWDAQGSGSLNIAPFLNSAFRSAGAPRSSLIASYTGQGLIQSWPNVGTRIGAGWSVGRVNLRRRDGTSILRNIATVNTLDGRSSRFPLWEIRARMNVDYDISRGYFESVSFTMDADIQPLIAGSEEPDPIELKFSTSAVGEAIDGVIPIGDLRRRSYFQSARGALSLRSLLERARAALRAQARAVEVSVDVPFAEAAALSCRYSATVNDPRLPGGTATGKVSEYAFGISASGEAFGRVTIGCTIGRGGTITLAEGQPSYVADGYTESGWQYMEGEETAGVDGDLAWAFDGSIEIQDDGYDLADLKAAEMIEEIEVTNGPTAQRNVLAEGEFQDANEAATALNNAATRVRLRMRDISGKAFETDYALAVQPLRLPKTIDLEAV